MSDFERSLAGLTPNAALDRDRLLFQAGARSATRSPRLAIPAMMLAFGLAIGGAGGWTMHGPEAVTVATTPAVIEAPSEQPPLDPSSYAALHERYLRGDFEAVLALHQDDSAPMPRPRSLAEQRKQLESETP